MSTEFISPNWRMPRNANQGKTASYSLNFDGNDHISFSDISLTGEFTISFWIKPNAFNFAIIGDASSQNWLRIYNATRTDLDLANTQSQWESGATFTTGEWQHVVLRRDSNNLVTIFRNGIHYTNNAPTRTATFGPINRIGQKANADYFNGQAGEICIFDYALSQNQITTLYGDSTNGPGNPMALPNTPIAYYPLATSAWNGNFLAENNAIGDYVFDFIPNDSIDTNFTLPNYSSYSIGVWYKKTGEPGEMPTGGDYFLWGNYTSGTAATARTSVRFNGTNKLRIITGNDTVAFQSTDLDVSTLLLDGKWHIY